MPKRLLAVLLIFAISIDQLVQVIFRAPIYVVLNRWKPSPNWTISGFVGALASKGYRIGLFLAPLIDGIFGQGHCARSYLHDDTIAPGADPV